MRRSHLIGIGALAAAGVTFALAVRGDRRGAVVVDPLEADRAEARARMETTRAEMEAARARATADADARHAMIEHLVDPGDGRRAGTTPFSIVGQPIGPISIALGDRYQREPGPDPTARRFTWNLPQLDDGTYAIATADVDDGVITRVTVDLSAPPDDVAAALRATYGDQGAQHAGPWRHGALAIELDATPRHASVTATLAR